MDHVFPRVTLTTDSRLEVRASVRDHSGRPFLNGDLRDGITWCDWADPDTANSLRELASHLDQAWTEIRERG